ncbi:MAG: phosphoglucosamine mutase, partial [Chromatocurvus sp.]
APSVLGELGAQVTAIGVQPDGFNINEAVGSTDMRALCNLVRETGSDLGIAYDGDGDRVLFVDEGGDIVDGDALLFIIARHRVHTGVSDAGVVGTLMSNLGLELALTELGLQLERAKVGDRYVRELMESQQWQLGGESSGHIICSDVTTTGDGIVASLQVLRALAHADIPLSKLAKGMTQMPQTMLNVRLREKCDVGDYPAIAQAVAETEAELGSEGRVLLRPSGTEPVVRVMVEGRDPEHVASLCSRLAGTVERCIGA